MDKSDEFQISNIDVSCCVEVNQTEVCHIADYKVREEIMKLVENYKPDKKIDVPVEMNIVLKDDEPVYG